MKMAEDGFQRGADDQLQPADLPTSSLASLHLRDEAVVINDIINHMVYNPESHSVSPVNMSSPLTKSQQQTDLSTGTSPKNSPAFKGMVCQYQY